MTAHCEDCGGDASIEWHGDADLWAAAVGQERRLCMGCFTWRCAVRGLPLTWLAARVTPEKANLS
jgi:hypothetical protein